MSTPLQDVPALDAGKFPAVDAAIESFIANRQMPGAVFHLERGGTIHQRAFGKHSYETDAAATTVDTVFDAASLTKVVATTPAVMLLIEQKKISLDAPLISYLPECTGGGKEGITIRHLLTHSSGLAAGLSPNPPWRGEAKALELACAQVVTHPPGTFFRYSDINFILLGLIVQRVGGMPLNEFVSQNIYRPLAMRNTGFLPLKRMAAERIAPTQKLVDRATQTLHADLADGEMLRGVVHDPTVRFMGGVGGSAGMFTTIGDLARYARMVLNGGELDGVRILSRESVALMSTLQSPRGVDVRRTAGWDIDSPYARPRGTIFPIGSFGHTGFTGCILWIDPFSKTFYAFLSNRVYPNDKSNILELYSRLGTLSAKAVSGFDFGNVAGALPPVAPPKP
ncbi:MAG: beta-lactamase family protein [Betaproteobacteria bacterium]|nr:beta-lactamase family protein [Betaproteobacteria bacterium]